MVGQTKTLNHPNGTSTLCNTDSCINVGISSRGASQIMGVLEPLGLAWGTDANAFLNLHQNILMIRMLEV